MAHFLDQLGMPMVSVLPEHTKRWKDVHPSGGIRFSELETSLGAGDDEGLDFAIRLNLAPAHAVPLTVRLEPNTRSARRVRRID